MPNPEITLTREEILETGIVTDRKTDGAQMAAVKVTGPSCRSNGAVRMRGETFNMEISLIPVHVAYGQVALVLKNKKK